MQVRREIVLPTTPDEAWAVLMDWERQADWMLDADRVVVVSERREGVGVRLAVKTRIAGIPAFTEPMEVTGWDPPRRLEIRHGSLVAGEGSWELGPVEGGTRFTWTEDIRLAIPVVGELAARCYRPVMRMLMGRAMDGLRGYVIAIGPGRTLPTPSSPAASTRP
ncbi:MAG: CoxG family protein [Actinomycetota bacterium]